MNGPPDSPRNRHLRQTAETLPRLDGFTTRRSRRSSSPPRRRSNPIGSAQWRFIRRRASPGKGAEDVFHRVQGELRSKGAIFVKGTRTELFHAKCMYSVLEFLSANRDLLCEGRSVEPLRIEWRRKADGGPSTGNKFYRRRELRELERLGYEEGLDSG
jgi:hypothetical protein